MFLYTQKFHQVQGAQGGARTGGTGGTQGGGAASGSQGFESQLSSALQQKGVTGENLDKAMNAADTDGTKGISQKEFEAAMKKLEGGDKKEEAKKAEGGEKKPCAGGAQKAEDGGDDKQKKLEKLKKLLADGMPLAQALKECGLSMADVKAAAKDDKELAKLLEQAEGKGANDNKQQLNDYQAPRTGGTQIQ